MNEYICLCHGCYNGDLCARKDCKRRPRFKMVADHTYLLCAECWDEVVRRGLVDETTGKSTVNGDSGLRK